MKHSRLAVRFDFTTKTWEKVVGGGARGRMEGYHMEEGGLVRILEMDPAWDESEWCTSEHVGYVLSGRVRLDFADQGSIEAGRGQAFLVPRGCAHKATCRRTTRMFMVG